METSTNQDYKGGRTRKAISDNFGRLLIETAWLPDSAGNMHRPCELTIDDLPPSFERDANLAEQLGMKRNEVAELAKKAKIPVRVIEALKNPGILAKFEELLTLEDEDGVDPISPSTK